VSLPIKLKHWQVAIFSSLIQLTHAAQSGALPPLSVLRIWLLSPKKSHQNSDSVAKFYFSAPILHCILDCLDRLGQSLCEVCAGKGILIELRIFFPSSNGCLSFVTCRNLLYVSSRAMAVMFSHLWAGSPSGTLRFQHYLTTHDDLDLPAGHPKLGPHLLLANSLPLECPQRRPQVPRALVT